MQSVLIEKLSHCAWRLDINLLFYGSCFAPATSVYYKFSSRRISCSYLLLTWCLNTWLADDSHVIKMGSLVSWTFLKITVIRSHPRPLHWMRSSLVLKAFGFQCRGRNITGFNPCILRYSGIWGTTDRTMLSKKNLYNRNPLLQSTLASPSIAEIKAL